MMPGYDLGGGCQTGIVYPVLPVDFAATADDFETVTLEWDETDAEADLVEIGIATATKGDGTVTTAGSVALVGDGTTFTDYKIGDLIAVTGEGVRIIASIPGDELLTVTEAFTTSDNTLDYYVSGNFAYLANVGTGDETYEAGSLTAETAYVFRLRNHLRLKWSSFLYAWALTPADT